MKHGGPGVGLMHGSSGVRSGGGHGKSGVNRGGGHGKSGVC